jgi:hypothetical protein
MNRDVLPTPIRRHDGPCGPRRYCWRPECRRFDPFRTIEILDTVAIAYCHQSTYHLGDPVLSIRGAA